MEKHIILRKIESFFSEFDKTLIFTIIALTFISIVTFISSSNGTYIKKIDHIRNFFLFFIVVLIFSKIHPKWFEKFAVWIFLISISLLIYVSFFGIVKKGARRWMDFIGIVLQPSELMKIAMPIILSWYFQKYSFLARNWNYFIGLIILCIPVILILNQPDLGTALIVFSSGMYVIIFSGFSWKILIAIIIIVMTLIFFTLFFSQHICEIKANWFILHEYQKNRICTFLYPDTDPLGNGFHILQSIIAIGSGGFFGKGWMHGTQAYLNFIPEKHTDFVFAVYSEEFGFLGNVVLLCLFFILIHRGLIIAGRASTVFAQLLAGSITMVLFTYIFINMAMVSGILPVVGIPLPFITYGGTALVTLGISIGILTSISKHKYLI